MVRVWEDLHLTVKCKSSQTLTKKVSVPLELRSPTSKNSGGRLRTPIDLIPFLKQSSNILVVGKNMEISMTHLTGIENRRSNKLLTDFQNIRYAPL